MVFKAMRLDEIIKGGSIDRKISDVKTEPGDTSVLKDQGDRRNQQGRLESEKRTEREDNKEKWCPGNQVKEVTSWGGQWF